MESKVILFCVLIFCSKIVDSISHPEDHVRQRVHPLSDWQDNQNAPNAQYLDTDLTQTRNINIQQSHPGRFNYDSNGFNRSPASSPSGKDVLVDYDSSADKGRLDSYPPRQESYKSRISQVGFDNQQYRNQNWLSQSQHTNSVPSAVHIPDDERPLVTTGQEPYRSQVQYLQPKYVPSSNRRIYQPVGSYLTREQYQYPLTRDSKYVPNSALRFGTSGQVPYKNYSKDQVATSEIKARPTGDQRYLQNFDNPTEITYNEFPIVVATDTLTDQSEKINYLENYKSRSHFSNTPPITNYNDVTPVITQADNYNSDTGASNGPVLYESYIDDQAMASEVKTRTTGDQRYLQNFETPTEITYNEFPTVVATDTLTDQSEKINYLENYKSRLHLSNTPPITKYNVGTPVITQADSYNSNTGESNGPVVYKSYIDDQAIASEVKTRTTGDQRYVQNFDTPTEFNYNEFPTVVATDTLTDQSEKINNLENYKSRLHFSNTPPITKYNDGTPVITHADNYNSNTGESNGHVLYKSYIDGQATASEVKTKPTGSGRYPQSFASQSGVNYNTAPVVIATETLKDQTENMKYVENYKSGSDLSYTAPITNQDHSFPLISEGDYNSDSISSNLAYVNIKNKAPVVIKKDLSEKPLAHRFSNNYKLNSGWSNIARDDSSYGAPVVTETAEVKSGKYEPNYKSDYGPKEPVPINTYSGVPSAPSDTVLVNSGSNKHEETNVAHHGSSSPTPLNTNPNQNVYNTKTSGITEFKLKSLVASPEVQKMLAGSNKRYLVIHSNGTVETMDKIDLESHQNSKLRLVHANRKNIDDSDSDGVLTQKSPEILPNHIAKTPAPVDENPLPTNDQPADDKKPTPLLVDQDYPADESNSNLSPQLKDLPANQSNLKPLPQPEKKPVDKNNSKLLPSYVIPPTDNNSSKTVTLNEDQSKLNDNLNPSPRDVNQTRDDEDSKPFTSYVNHAAVDGNSKALSQNKNQTAVDDNLKLLSANKNQLADDDNSKLLTPKEDQPESDIYSKLDKPKDKVNFTPFPTHVKKSKHTFVQHSANDNHPKPLPTIKNQTHDDKPFYPYTKQPAHYNKSKKPHINRPEDDNNSSTSVASPGEDATRDDNTSEPLPSNASQSGDDNGFIPLRPNIRQPAHHNKSKHSHGHQSKHDKNSNPLSPRENEPENYDNSKPSSSKEHQSADETDSTILPSHKKQPSHKPNSRQSHDQPSDDNNSSPTSTPVLNYPENQPSVDHTSNPSSPGDDPTGGDNTSEPLPSNASQSGDDNDFKPLRPDIRQPAHHNKSKHSHVNQSEGDKNSNPSSPGKNEPENYVNSKPSSSKEHQSGDETDSTILSSHKKQPSHKPNSRQPHDQPADDNNSSPTSTPLLNNPENQPSVDHTSNPSSPGDDPTRGDNTKPLPPNKNQDEEEKCEDEDDLIKKPTPADQTYSTTVSPTVPRYTTSSKPKVLKTHTHKHSHRKSTTNSPAVSTTPCPDDTLENQIITLSPIEQTTDNVREVPSVGTTTTTTSTTRTPGKSDIINEANNKQVDAQDDIAHTYSTTTVSPSTTTPPTDSIIDGKTIGTTENKNTQIKDNTVVDQVNNNQGKDTRTAVYSSSELFDTNTDVPAKSDDYSSTTALPSVQTAVNTGDASGDNSLELEQSETDVTITVSSSKANNSEDETITINIEISESTDNADSSSNDKSLVVSIDTNDDSDDDSKTPKPDDCKKEHTSDDGRGKNVEIDMSNLKGEPTMWIRTTNQDFIDKLTAKNDTAFDVIYFFHIDNQPVIEREKATTIYCNGTVVIETTETKYTHKDDPAPTVVKTTKIVDVITDVV